MQAQSPMVDTISMYRKVWMLAWPIMLSNITVPLLGLVDTAVLGHLDSVVYLGAVALGSQMMMLLFWSFGFLRMATTAHSSHALGEDKQKKNHRVLVQGIIFSLVLSPIIIGLSYPLLPYFLELTKASAEVQHHAYEYVSIRLYATPAILLQFVFIGWFIGQGNSRIPLMLLLISNSVNAILDVILVFQFDYRADGIAWATVAADYTGLILSCILVSRLGFRWSKFKKLTNKIKTQQLMEWMMMNRDLFIRTVFLLSVLIFFTIQGARQSDVILAMNAIMISFLLLISNALDGYAHAAETLIARYLGSKDSNLFQQSIRVTGVFSVITAIGLTLLLAWQGELVIWLLSDQESILTAAEEYRYWFIAFPLMGVASFWLDGVFVGAHAATKMRNAMVLAVVLVFIPTWFLTQGMDNHGLWLSFYLFFMARALMLVPAFLTLYKKLEK